VYDTIRRRRSFPLSWKNDEDKNISIFSYLQELSCGDALNFVDHIKSLLHKGPQSKNYAIIFLAKKIKRYA